MWCGCDHDGDTVDYRVDVDGWQLYTEAPKPKVKKWLWASKCSNRVYFAEESGPLSVGTLWQKIPGSEVEVDE